MNTVPSKLPRLIVFDLDYTLWPFYIDTHVTPPFQKTRNSSGIKDNRGARIKIYNEVPQVLEYVNKLGVPMAIASRTSETEGAIQLVNLLGWDKYFRYKEIYPGSKINHFTRFKEQSHIDFKDMLFFDDEERNIKDLSEMHVTCVLVLNGMNMAALKSGLETFALK